MWRSQYLRNGSANRTPEGEKQGHGRDLGEEIGTVSLGSCNPLSSNHDLSLGQISRISMGLVLASGSRNGGAVPIHSLALWSIACCFYQSGTWWGWADPQKWEGCYQGEEVDARLALTTAVHHRHFCFIKGKKGKEFIWFSAASNFLHIYIGVQILTIFN